MPPIPAASNASETRNSVSSSRSSQRYPAQEVHIGSRQLLLTPGTTRYHYDNIENKALPPLPPSTDGSLSNSLLSARPPSHRALTPAGGEDKAKITPVGGQRIRSSSSHSTSSFIETLPNEILELIFHFAIASSFPSTENLQWPIGPMFSRGRRSRGTRHSPSNSSGSEVSSSGVSMRSVSSGRTQTEVAVPIHPDHLLPTTLSQTCRRFRFVLRCSPELWSFIHLTRSADWHAREGPSFILHSTRPNFRRLCCQCSSSLRTWVIVDNWATVRTQKPVRPTWHRTQIRFWLS